MRKLLTILCLLFSLTVSSQCVSNQSFVISTPGPYSPGQVIAVDYTLGTFTQVNIKPGKPFKAGKIETIIVIIIEHREIINIEKRLISDGIVLKKYISSGNKLILNTELRN